MPSASLASHALPQAEGNARITSKRNLRLCGSRESHRASERDDEFLSVCHFHLLGFVVVTGLVFAGVMARYVLLMSSARPA